MQSFRTSMLFRLANEIGAFYQRRRDHSGPSKIRGTVQLSQLEHQSAAGRGSRYTGERDAAAGL
jgi:hypothetical protein